MGNCDKKINRIEIFSFVKILPDCSQPSPTAVLASIWLRSCAAGIGRDLGFNVGTWKVLLFKRTLENYGFWGVSLELLLERNHFNLSSGVVAAPPTPN